jgi:hypothetical protein
VIVDPDLHDVEALFDVYMKGIVTVDFADTSGRSGRMVAGQVDAITPEVHEVIFGGNSQQKSTGAGTAAVWRPYHLLRAGAYITSGRFPGHRAWVRSVALLELALPTTERMLLPYCS